MLGENTVMQPLNTTECQVLAQCPDLCAVDAGAVFPHVSGPTSLDGLLLQVHNSHCRGALALQGAQVLRYQPAQCSDLLWLSPNAMVQSGTAIRGGIPVCLPWFGINQRDPGKPKHGFARLCRWTLERAYRNDQGGTCVSLALRDYAERAHPLFDYPFEAQLQLTFGRALVLELAITNTATSPMPLSWALHSYHPVADLERVTVTGLQQGVYLDNTRQLERVVQQANPRFGDELDRVYLNVAREQIIVNEPAISIRGDQAPTAIVWNPGPVLAASMVDLGPNLHRQFICVERGAAFDNEQMLAPGDKMRSCVTIQHAAD
jgi:glucose-6-phosphate 1-epimerase